MLVTVRCTTLTDTGYKMLSVVSLYPHISACVNHSAPSGLVSPYSQCQYLPQAVISAPLNTRQPTNPQCTVITDYSFTFLIATKYWLTPVSIAVTIWASSCPSIKRLTLLPPRTSAVLSEVNELRIHHEDKEKVQHHLTAKGRTTTREPKHTYYPFSCKNIDSSYTRKKTHCLITGTMIKHALKVAQGLNVQSKPAESLKPKYSETYMHCHKGHTLTLLLWSTSKKSLLIFKTTLTALS